MKRFENGLRELAPPGFPWRKELGVFLAAEVLAMLYSLRFLIEWSEERRLLFRNR